MRHNRTPKAHKPRRTARAKTPAPQYDVLHLLLCEYSAALRA